MNIVPTPHSGDLYARITDDIIRAIEQGATTFEMPWHRGGPCGGLPRNAATQAPYRGINTLALWARSAQCGYASPEWATYRQWQQLGAQVRRGEKGSVIVYSRKDTEAQPVEETATGPESRKSQWILRGFVVFNAEQIEGRKKQPPVESAVMPHATLDAFVSVLGAEIIHESDRAFYDQRADCIHLPDRARFRNTSRSTATEGYYATLLHEHIHWTGHASRIHRDLSGKFGGFAYAMEELVAELGAAFLCGEFGFGALPREDHAAYVDSWLQVLHDRRTAIFLAASAATAACRYMYEQEENARKKM